MELQAVTGQLHILNGAIQQEPFTAGMLAQVTPSKPVRGRENDILFVHITLGGPQQEQDPLLDDLVRSISTRFYETPGSVTAALRRAISETNRSLLEYNLSGAVQAREGALTCAVQKGEELYIAQVGEAFAVVGHVFGVERLPVVTTEPVIPFGRTANVDIRYYHNWLQNGDMLLLADPRLSHVPMDEFHTILSECDVEDGLVEIGGLVGPDTSRVMLIEFTDDAPAYLPDAVPDLPVTVSRRKLPPPTKEPQREGDAAAPAGYTARAVSHLSQVDGDMVETTALRATSGAAKGLSRAAAWLAEILVRLRPPKKQSSEFSGWAMPMFLALGIPITVAAIVAGVYFQRGSVVEISDLKTAMRENLYLARQEGTDLKTQLDYYNQVLQLASEAEGYRPDDPEVAKIRREALSDLDAMEGVARLYAEELYAFPEDAKLSALVLGDFLNGGLFTLDSENDRVYLHRTGENFEGVEDNDPEVILKADQSVGGEIATELVDILWRPRGNDVTRDGLAILDETGVVFSYYPNLSDLRSVPLGFAIDWKDPSAVATYFERLYILDHEADEIWRYLPDGDGFVLQENDRAVQLEMDVDLAHVVDMDIHKEDGSIMLLYEDGRIRRYGNQRMLWDEKSLYESGLTTRLVSPISIKIVGQGLGSSIYILDPGSDRLIQISLGGTFLAQYKVEDHEGEELLNRARDFAIASNPHRIFLIGEDTLYVAAEE